MIFPAQECESIPSETEVEVAPPPPEVAAETVAAVAMAAAADAHDEDEKYPPRSCLIRRWYDFTGEKES